MNRPHGPRAWMRVGGESEVGAAGVMAMVSAIWSMHLNVMPPVEVAAARLPCASMATAPTVSCHPCAASPARFSVLYRVLTLVPYAEIACHSILAWLGRREGKGVRGRQGGRYLTLRWCPHLFCDEVRCVE